MSILVVVETGAGLANSNSYVAVADADAYFANRGNTAWAGIADQKAAAVIIATAFLDAKFRERWRGRKITKDQALTWPRIGATIDGSGADIFIEGFGPRTDGFIIATTEIPSVVQQAVYELALRVLLYTDLTQNPLMPDINPGDGRVSMEKIGPIETHYIGTYNPSIIWRYPFLLVAPLILNSNISIPIERS